MDTNQSKFLSGKAITTSVPTIKFSTGAEEVVEVFSSFCEEEAATIPSMGSASSSPKHDHARSTTPIDDTVLTSTPASDPWRFFSGIKGKITKSVEGKLIEYKNKSATSTGIPEDNASPSAGTFGRSPKHHQQGNYNSSAGNSRSDSEDISESSLSRTQGGLSTTEGVEMSSTDEEEDDEDGTPSQSQITSETVQQDQKTPPPTVQTAAVVTPTTTGGLRYRLRTIRGSSGGNTGSTSTETTVGESFLRALQRLAGDNNDCQEVRTEQGVDVLEDMDIEGASGAMEPLDLNIENVTITSDDVIEVREVLGSEIRTSLQADLTKSLHQQKNESELVNSRTIFNPTQFVDLRHLMCSTKVKTSNTNVSERNYKVRKAVCVTLVFLVIYFALSPLSVYFSGFILGVVSTLVIIRVLNKWLELTGGATVDSDINETVNSNVDTSVTGNAVLSESTDSISVWMNEWPAPYTPQMYTVACTQPVHLRLQRHLLRVSSTNARLSKRDMMKTSNETNINADASTCAYTRHRIYDLRGATVTLLPVGLTRIRWWSKKYPICIELTSPDQLTTEPAQTLEEQPEATAATSVSDKTSNRHQQVLKQTVRKRRKWHQHSSNKDFGQEKTPTIMFSKLMLDDKDAVSMIDTLDLAVPEGMTISNMADPNENKQQEDIKAEESEDNVDPTKTRIYLFARTCRDKETWYQLLTSASSSLTTESLVSNVIYHNYMDTILNQRFNNSSTTDVDKSDAVNEEIGTAGEQLVWLNALLGRAWYSYAAGGESATMRLKDRIQRKLATIRLPAFIEELKLSELSISAPQIGQKVPIQIRWASHPLMDTRGIWVDFDLEYESSVVLILQTKLNLMRLKSKSTVENEQNAAGVCDAEYKSAIFHSDVDDSAESSSDDDSGGDSDKMIHTTDAVDTDGAVVSTAGSTTTNQSPNHKLIRMVDRIADSRLFRAATEYRYVQRALENVRNTDLCLRVEVRSISGRVCVNIPPPPSDRLWFGFRATPEPPKLCLRALPTVGDYHISLQHVTGWLERRLTREFHKVLVLPNMEDIVLPGLR